MLDGTKTLADEVPHDLGEDHTRDTPLDARTLASVIIVLGMLAGLSVPHLAELAAPFVMPALFILGVASLTPLRDALPKFIAHIDKCLVAGVVWLQFGLPAVVVVLCIAIGVPAKIAALLLVSATASLVFASPAIAQIIGLDRRCVTHLMIATTLAMPFSLPLFLSPFVDFDGPGIFLLYAERVAIFLVLPLAIVIAMGWALRPRSARTNVAVDQTSHWISVVALGVFAVGITDGVAETFAAHPGEIVSMLVAIVLLGVLMYAATWLVFPAERAKLANVLSIFSLTRNVGLSYAVVGHVFGPELAIYVALCQIPALCLPLILRIKSTNKRDGPVDSQMTAYGSVK